MLIEILICIVLLIFGFKMGILMVVMDLYTQNRMPYEEYYYKTSWEYFKTCVVKIFKI